jgi:hypothetical protein
MVNLRAMLLRVESAWSVHPLASHLVWALRTVRSGDTLLVAFRWFVVVCQAATLLITWPLWQVRSLPPMLPALPLPYFDMGAVLLVSLALILVRPKIGIVLHTALMAYAVLIDQTRLQPEIVSLIFLLWGTLPDPNLKTLARAHLIALWCFAGLNKLLSPAFMNSGAQWMLTGLIPAPPSWLRDNFGFVIVAAESGTGLLAIFPRTRKLAGLMALGLHLGILLDLSPLGHNWNQSVWPWNAALAFAGLALIAPWHESLPRTLKDSRWFVRVLAIYLLVAPVGFYFGVTDAYLAHNLYSSNIPSASTSGSLNPGVTWTAFNVPLPPEHRLFEQFFYRSCHSGNSMVIYDSRWWFRIQGLAERHLTCPAEGARSK